MRHVLLLFTVSCLIVGSAVAQTTLRVRAFTTATADPDSTSADLATIPNRAILQTGQNTNIAKGKKVTVRYASIDPAKISQNVASIPSNLTDGIISSSNFLEILPGQEGTQIMIDLGAIRLVNRIAMRTTIINAKDFRVRGYSLYLGIDSLTFGRVKLVPDNDTTATDDSFTPDTARFVMIQIDKLDRPGGFSTLLSEIRIFAVGFLSGGQFVSKVQNMNTTVNWGGVRWWSSLPDQTEIKMQVRTGGTSTPDATWSPWCDEISRQNATFDVYEPRQYMQYRATLYTYSLDTPRLDSLEFDYDTLLVANSTSARITPQSVEILKSSRVSYDISLGFSSRSRGIDSLIIFTSTPIVIVDAAVDNTPVGFGVTNFPGRTAVGFSSTISSGTKLSVGFKVTPVYTQSRFPAQIISKAAAGNPQRVDPASVSGTEGWMLTATGIPERIISTPIVDPNPFTPNGDGKNDVTQFEFFVTNLVEARPVRLTIYDITGRIVRRLLDVQSAAKAYVEQDAVAWDGKDDNGKLLPPGLYVYQIVVETDGLSPAVMTRTVTIAY